MNKRGAQRICSGYGVDWTPVSMKNGMRAIVRDSERATLRDVPRPAIAADDDVVIDVALVGVCRTDIYAAEGLIACPDGLVLGHEFAGTVAAVGSAVRHLARGDRVAVMPHIACRDCETCRAGFESACPERIMLGLDRDGAFAEQVRVPARVVHHLPDGVDFATGAYCEPIAASLAVLKAPIQPGERGLIHGGNRIAELTRRVLVSRGFRNVTVHDPRASGAALPSNAFDFAIETMATTEAMDDVLRAVRPQGRVILKSRDHRPVGVRLSTAVPKELTFHAVNYGCFREALQLVAEGALDLTGLLGARFRLEQFREVFKAASAGESSKLFFEVGDERVRNL